jgi:thiamine transport system substrate-binding protein
MKKCLLISGILLITFIFCGCNRDANSIGKGNSHNKKFSILCTDRVKTTGFLNHIIPAFEKENKCQVVVYSVNGISELTKVLQTETELRKYDLILGLDNVIVTEMSDFNMLTESNALKKHSVNSQFIIDKSNKLIPYGFGYLSLLYNENTVSQPPESFGELQDARFLNQLVLSDARNSAIGRATLYWTIALFGNEGYQQFWKSVKKNIHSSKENWSSVIQSLELQEGSMTFGFSSTPAWIMESKTNPLPIRASLMKEGSFLFIEAAAIPKKAKNKGLSEAFLSYLLSPEAQKFVAYDLGLFPANESTPLPNHFASVPFVSYTVNEKLESESIRTNKEAWLDFWDRLFTSRVF